MKKFIILAYICLLISTLVGCSLNSLPEPTSSTTTKANVSHTASSSALSSTTSKTDIPFEYFYRGFFPVDNNDYTLIPGDKIKIGNAVYVIETADDWSNFENKYLAGMPLFVNVDFSKEDLIAVISSPAKPTWNATIDFSSVGVKNNMIDIEGGANNSTCVIAQNAPNYINYSLTIVKVKKDYIPSGIQGVYKQ
jgi:hypothetical protein